MRVKLKQSCKQFFQFISIVVGLAAYGVYLLHLRDSWLMPATDVGTRLLAVLVIVAPAILVFVAFDKSWRRLRRVRA